MAIAKLSEVLNNYQPSNLGVSGDEAAIVTALATVGALIVGWYPNAHFGRDEVFTWVYLLDGFDPELFVPAIIEYAKQNPDWPPTAPQFRIVVDEVTRRRRNEEMRRRNQVSLAATEARLIEEACVAGTCVDPSQS
jgi:hypothetical protein